MDNPFDTPVTGQADWDSGLGSNFQALERGYHVTERAGIAVNTGMLLQLNSGGFFAPWTNAGSDFPHAMAYTAALSGETLTALAWGIMRSLDINSVVFPGAPLYGSATTPGLIVTSPSGPVIGVGLTGNGVLFNPAKVAGGGGGGGGVTMIQSLSDVDITGLNNDSILKWSNTTSKFVMAVDSAGGGGGGGVAAYPFAPPPISSLSIGIGSPVAITSRAYGTVIEVGSSLGTNHVSGYGMLTGAAPYTYAVGLNAMTQINTGCFYGLGITDGNQMVTLGYRGSTNEFFLAGWSSNVGTGSIMKSFLMRDNYKYMRITNTGSNFICGVSNDGEHWWDAFTNSSSYIITTTPQVIGVIGNSTGSGYTSIVAEYFAKTA